MLNCLLVHSTANLSALYICIFSFSRCNLSNERATTEAHIIATYSILAIILNT